MSRHVVVRGNGAGLERNEGRPKRKGPRRYAAGSPWQDQRPASRNENGADRDAWRRGVNAPIVESAWDSLCGSVVQEVRRIFGPKLLPHESGLLDASGRLASGVSGVRRPTSLGHDCVGVTTSTAVFDGRGPLNSARFQHKLLFVRFGVLEAVRARQKFRIRL